ncbi:MAG: Gfo/Idh/MocA family oxidoreductase [Chloroflexota bacterium]
MKKIRWGIIGCGAVTEVKSGPGLQLAEGSKLVAVMRRNGALAADYAQRHGVPKWSDDANVIIHDSEIDAVYVATPPGSHLDYALQVCAAGKPCYVEKPIARNATESRQMVDAFAAAGLPLFVAYYRRALPRFLKAKRLIEEGRLGKITNVSYQYRRPTHQHAELPWRLLAEEAGGGFFMDLGSHTLDILDFMLGPLVDVAGTAVNRSDTYQVEDGIVMHFRTQSGGLGTAAWDFKGLGREDMIEIVGTNGRLSLSTFGNEPVQLETAVGVETFDLPNALHVQQPLIQTIVNDLLQAEPASGHCASTGASALRTALVQDTVLASFYGGRDDAYWSRPETWPGSAK